MDIMKGVPDVTLEQNIFVFQFENEELCICIGGDVTVLTKVKQTFKISVKTLSSKLHNKCHLQLIHSICHTFKMHPKSNIKTKLYSN